ncbi:hypothetical protein H6F51_10910 [Cyanobacteria bacterium FACHB-DQ100]|nr:hypothetical protein [Cyanobacteria bacterium FACHB-DQ100]
MRYQPLQKFVSLKLGFKPAFPHDSSYSASKVVPIAHDEVKSLNSKDKHTGWKLAHSGAGETVAHDL